MAKLTQAPNGGNVSTLDRKLGRTVFGSAPDLYARGRPGYPPRVAEILRDLCRVGPETAAFEIGPGTGQATARLLDLGCTVCAIEPDARLAAYLSESLGPAHPGRLTVMQAPFEEAALPSTAFDLGVAATSFHWLDPAIGLPKVKQLLRPGGHWAMWWNVYGDPDAPDDFQVRTHALFDSLERPPTFADREKKPYALNREQRLAELEREGFEERAVEIIRWDVTFSTGQMLALSATFSPVAQLPEPARNEFLEALRRVGDDEFAGSIPRRFLTAVYTARSPRRMSLPA